MCVSTRDPLRSPYHFSWSLVIYPSTTRVLRNLIETMHVLGFEHCALMPFSGNTPRNYGLCYSAARLPGNLSLDSPCKALLTYTAEDFSLPQDNHIAPSRCCETWKYWAMNGSDTLSGKYQIVQHTSKDYMHVSCNMYHLECVCKA